MARIGKPRHPANLSRSKIISFFMRLMERQQDRRSAMNDARAATDPKYYGEIIQRLIANPQYKWALVGHPFPATPEHIQRKIKLGRCDPDREFTWSANVLKLYEEELRDFVVLRTRYENEFLHGNYPQASDTLEQIQTSHGYSHWLVSSRIQLLATSEGLQAQKKYLEELLEKNISPIFGWISYYCSLRSEENYSLGSILEVTSGTRNNPPLFDYVTYHLNPYHILDVDDPVNIISWEEMHPVIDRLHAHVVAAKLTLSRDSKTDCVLKSLEMLTNICDPAIERLIRVAREESNQEATNIYDDYLSGDYNKVLSSNITSAELRALSLLQSSITAEDSASIISQAVRCMSEMLLPREGYLRAKQQLQKIALLCGHLPLTTEIASFIARTLPTLPVSDDFSAIEKYATLSYGRGRYCLPTSTRFLNKYNLEISESTAGTAPTQKLIRALREGNEELLCSALSQDIRDYYAGCIKLSHGNAVEAEIRFRAAANSPIEYVRSIADIGIFESLRAKGDLAAAVKLAVNTSLKTPDRFRLYPFETLASEIRDQSSDIDPILVAVLFHFASRTNSTWDGELSDAYENTLNSRGVVRPSELDIDNIDPVLLYFLRDICVPRIMEDSTEFASVDDVEAERILICQHLLSKDSDNIPQYADEIKTITREKNVSALLKHVEANMIYVDTSGVSTVVHDSLKESYERYQVLLASPDLGYQAEQINRMIKELVTKLGGKESWDIALTSSEKAGLFTEMREYFLETFATNPAYGLDTNLSTSIRHGVIEGHIRAPFVEEDLLAIRDGNENWKLPETWAEKLATAPPTELNELTKSFGRFAQRVEDTVHLYRDELIHIRRNDNKRQGLFFLQAQDDEIIKLAQSISVSTSYDEFLSYLFEHAWKLLDKSMVEIKSRIRRDLLGTLKSATEALVKSATSIQSARQTGLVDAIARAQTSMQAKVEEIANWFRRPTDVRNSPFDVELALLVAAQQIKNCYTGAPLDYDHKIDGNLRIEGAFLNGLVEVVFLFLQNAVRHSGFHEQKRNTPISIKVSEADGEIALEFKNSLAPTIDLCDRRAIASAALLKHSSDSAISMANSEGGSGLSKLKRILKFDIKRSYRLNLEVTDDRSFLTTLHINSEGMKHADLSR